MSYLPFVVIAFLLLVAATSFLRFRDPLYPPVIHSSVWALVIFLFVLNRDAFYPLGWEFYSLVGFGGFAFALGSYIATYRFRPVRSAVPISPAETDWLQVAVLAILVIALPFYVHRSYQVAAGGPSGNLLLDMRFNMIFQHREFGPLGYLMPLSFIVAGVHLLVAPSKRLRTAVAVLVATTYGVLSTGRTPLFFLALFLFGILLMTRRLKVKHAMITAFVCLATIFVVVAIVQGRGVEVHASFRDNLVLFGQNFRLYLLGPLAAFDRYIRSDPAPTLGTTTFRFFFALGERMGLDLPVVSLIQPFTKVPAPINVYTVYHPYFADFSFPGAAMVQVFFGFVHALLYRKAKSGDPMFICLFSLALHPLLLQFFQDQYFMVLSSWAQFTIALWLYFRLWGRWKASRMVFRF